MNLLRDILDKVTLEKVVGTTAVSVRELHFDSREIGLDDVFVAIRGTVSDGHEFIKKAVDQGAIAVICEEIPDQIVNG
ncbi:MAG: Mur ligase domain-containing protein, partial [Marinirhabdus sp.]|nr:Mur ligase domain-containing protein [Marinirhabdus sp.]